MDDAIGIQQGIRKAAVCGGACRLGDSATIFRQTRRSPQDLAPRQRAWHAVWLPRHQRACPSAGLDGCRQCGVADAPSQSLYPDEAIDITNRHVAGLRHTLRMRRLVLLLLCCALPLQAGAPSPPPTDIADLRIEAADGYYLAWAINRLPGPIEVRLDAPVSPGMASQPALPARAGVPAGGQVLVARISPPAGRSGRLQLRLLGVPGSSNARPRDVLYLAPLARTELRVDQGFEGSFSHDDAENRYALDFATPPGTPVLAARAGVVMQVEQRHAGNGQDRARDAAQANFIRILHDDGSMALYAHLAEHGALVRQGQQVTAGQRIGLSGNTGFSTAPHLHFAVQANRGMQLVSLKFRMQGVPSP